ncbi:hypothetical protein [Shewanella violacea]|uniref:Orphan protein n=1 Tax=Shewanella violacea (strain JCM 10179 / CIP 106290 / LMG 19151 / DSS12) TaxID=637905 RepID=D4ZGN3_SHEVD|nr:hypothetical protein [Shewanella violacea]BAJ00832.1 hypothetical protein SVI_0861 [Shewanella violacea DSS12]
MNIYKSYLLSLATFTCISNPTFAQTEKLANILDYQPKCIIETLEPLSIQISEQDYVGTGAFEEREAFKQALQTLRIQATQQGADAISLTDVNHIMHSTKQLSVNNTNFRTKYKKANTRLTTNLKADLYKLCLHDKSLTKQRTAFNSQGYKMHSFGYSYTISLPEDRSPAGLAKKILVPAPYISLESGAYGIELGMMTTQVRNRLGPPSIEINLESNNTAWGYGRSLWFVFTNNSLIKINSSTPLLTAYGKNLIEPREGFDDISWRVNGEVPQKTNLSDAIIQLPQAKELAGGSLLNISNQTTQLQLSFEKFHPKRKAEPVYLLTEYQLYPRSNNGVSKKNDVTHIPTASQLSALFSLLSFPQANNPTLSQLQNIYPQMSRLNISGSGVWWLIGDHLQVQYKNNQLSKIRVSPSVFAAVQKQENTQAQFFQSIKQLGLPTDKQSLLKQYKDASDNFDMVDLYRDDFFLLAKYESDEENSEIYELEIEYF